MIFVVIRFPHNHGNSPWMLKIIGKNEHLCFTPLPAKTESNSLATRTQTTCIIYSEAIIFLSLCRWQCFTAVGWFSIGPNKSTLNSKATQALTTSEFYKYVE